MKTHPTMKMRAWPLWSLFAFALFTLLAASLRAAPGNALASFQPSVDGIVYTTALQPDGKLLIGGEFASVNGSPRIRLARLNADGTLDATFVPAITAGDAVNTIALQPDGKVIVGGKNLFSWTGTEMRQNLLRLNADGSLDGAFVSDPDGEVVSAALQADGKLVVAGSFSVIGSGGWAKLARVEADGSIDAGFQASGLDGAVYAVLIAQDGKIVVGGAFTTISTVSRNRIARLQSTGFPDATFDPGADDTVWSLAEQSDGKLLVGGSFATIAGGSRSGFARLSGDGTLDAAFDAQADAEVTSIAVQADGGIIAGGWFSTIGGQPRSYLAKLDADGTVDAGFLPQPDAPPLAIALVEDGTCLTGGVFSTVGGLSQSYLAALENEASSSSFLVHGRTRAEWLRGGAAPELARVEFEASDDGGMTWAALGVGSRIAGGWELDGLSLAGSGQVRARGFVADGSSYNGSGIVEATAEYPIFTVNFALGSQATRTGGGELVQRIDEGEAAVAPELATIGDWMFNGWDTAFDNVTENLTVTATYVLPGQTDDSYAGSVEGGLVRSLARQPDGKVIVCGSFTTVDGEARSYIARLHADGTLDETFAPTPNQAVNAAAIQPDGRIVIGGFFAGVSGTVSNYLARLEPDGTVDASFAPGISGGPIQAIVVQADGRILIGGAFTSVGGVSKSYLARLHADGSLDTSLDIRPGANVNAIAMQTDGGIVFGGAFTSVSFPVSGGSAGYSRGYLARILPSGAFDTAYAPSASATVTSLASLADGRMYVGGYFTAMNGSGYSYLARLQASGALDGSFWVSPINAAVHAIALQQDGSLFIGGDFTQVRGNSAFPHLAHVSDTGVLDTSFAPALRGSNFSTGSTVLAIAVLADGKVLAGGTSYNYLGIVYPYFQRLWSPEASQTMALVSADRMEWSWSATSPAANRATVEISTDGGTSWHLVTDAVRNPSGWELDGLALQGAGRLRGRAYVLDGSFENGSSVFEATVPYDEGGVAHLVVFDTGEHGARSGGGYLAQTVATGGAATAPTIMPEDGWVFDGWSESFDAVTADVTTVALYSLAPGEMDPSFDPNASYYVYCSQVQPDGKILIGGQFTIVGGQTRPFLARIEADGTVDAGFAPQANGVVTCMSLQADGAVLIGGSFTAVNGVARNRIARILADGTLDTTFTASASSTVNCIVQQPDGAILIGGNFTSPRPYIARLGSDGTLDSAFLANPNSYVQTIAVQPDGKILVGGGFTSIRGAGRDRIARLNADSTLDTTFYSGANNTVRSITLQPDGKLLVAGDFTALVGGTRYRLARLLPTGVLDGAFYGNAFNSSVVSVALQADGAMFACGSFSQVNSASHPYLVKLTSAGVLDSSFSPAPNASVSTISLTQGGALFVGGYFTAIDGIARNRMARFILAAPTNTLSVPAADEVLWLRDGSCPEAQWVTISYSADGNAPWQDLGQATRTAGGWALTGLSLPAMGHIRARANTSDGSTYNGGGIVEASVAYELAVTPGSFEAWMAEQGLTGEPSVVFSAPSVTHPGLPNGLVYAFGGNLVAGMPALRVVVTGERRIAESIAQDSATLPFVDLEVIGSTTMLPGSWTLLVSPSVDLAGKPPNTAWHEQDGAPAPAAFFRLKATLHE